MEGEVCPIPESVMAANEVNVAALELALASRHYLALVLESLQAS